MKCVHQRLQSEKPEEYTMDYYHSRTFLRVTQNLNFLLYANRQKGLAKMLSMETSPEGEFAKEG